MIRVAGREIVRLPFKTSYLRVFVAKGRKGAGQVTTSQFYGTYPQIWKSLIPKFALIEKSAFRRKAS